MLIGCRLWKAGAESPGLSDSYWSNETNRLDSIEETQLRKGIPDFQSGDTVRVHVRIKESETKDVCRRLKVSSLVNTAGRETITVRKTSFGVGVERIFPLHATSWTTLT